MPGLTTSSLRTAGRRAGAAVGGLETELNDADAKLGDGDTGQTVRRVLEAVETALIDAPADVGAAFARLAQASAGATGSSLGTLFTTGLLALSRGTGGRAEVPWPELGGLLADAGSAMARRGRAALGDKTVLDAVYAVAGAIAGLDTPAAIGTAASVAVARSLAAFRDRPCRIGRARMFADRSVGLDDPGMLAFARLVVAVAGR